MKKRYRGPTVWNRRSKQPVSPVVTDCLICKKLTDRFKKLDLFKRQQVCPDQSDFSAFYVLYLESRCFGNAKLATGITAFLGIRQWISNTFYFDIKKRQPLNFLPVALFFRSAVATKLIPKISSTLAKMK